MPLKLNSINFLLITLPFVIVFGNRIVLFKNSFEIPVIVFFMILTVIIWRIKGQIQLESVRLFLYLLVCGAAIIVNLFSYRYSADFSSSSLLYLFVLYFPVVFIHKQPTKARTLFESFQKAMLVISIIGILQFVTQLAGIPYRDWLLYFFPRFIDEFNTSIPLFQGSSLFRSNGLFLLEPSFYSQYLAIAILLDIFFFKNFKRLPLFILAILLSFAGTGLVILFFGFLINITKIPLKKFIFPSLVAVFILLGFFFSDFGTVSTNRLAEFNNQNSSAYNRFIAPFQSFEYFYDQGAKVFLLGGGAGSIDSFRILIQEDIPVMHPNFFIKTFYEYGMISGTLLLIFILYLFWGRKSISKLRFPLFIMYAIVSAGLLNAQQLYFCYVIGMLFVEPNKEL